MAHFDTATPNSALSKHKVDLSEYEDWGDVARWGSALFQHNDQHNDQGDTRLLDQKAAELMAATSDPQQRVVAALRFVQQEIRYFGTETGLNSHQPAQPATVLAQRFGDCKDKTGLLVALLRRMDITAWPVLVSTSAHGHIESDLPSPLAFDHVIARVDLGGQTHWLDATRSLQTGTLQNRQAISFERGLSLMPSTTALSVMPSAVGQERAFLHDAFKVRQFAEPVRLESRLTYRGELADYIRDTVASKGLQDIATQLAQSYIRAYPKIVSALPTRLEASDTDDAVTLVQTFDIPDFWRFPEQRQLVGDAVHWLLLDEIRPPNEATRQDALSLGHMGVFRQLTTVDYPEDVASGDSSERFEDGDAHVALKSVVRTEPGRVEIASEVRVMKDEVPADRFASYKALYGKLAPHLVYTVSAPALGQARLDRLRKEAADAKEGIRRGQTVLSTPTQVSALYRSMLLSAQLDEGRLSPALRAEVLTARGIQLDHQGRAKEAEADFAAALALSADSPETLNAAATNAMSTGNYGQVLGFADRVLKTRPHDGEARQARALARLYSQDYASAKTDFEELVKDGDHVQRGYPLVWLGILAQREGRQPVEAIAAFRDSQLPRAWPRPLVDWMRGSKSLDELLADAQKGEAAPQQLTEAYYYVGERYLAQGDVGRASDYFRKTVDLKVVEFVEYGAAKNRLAALQR